MTSKSIGADERAVLSAVEERLDSVSAKGLADAVSAAARAGAIAPGDRLPPIRTVARELALSPTTVSAAWRDLARAGIIRTEGRRGTRVNAPAMPSPERYGRVLTAHEGIEQDLSTGVPDPALLPSLTAALAALPGAAVPRTYLDDPVLPELREVIATDWPYRAEHLAVVDGAMDGIELVARTALRFGDRVAVENPCFPPLVDLLTSLGVTVVGIPVDEEGMDAGALAEVAKGELAAVLLQPRAQNPTGVCLSSARAEELAAVCERADLLVVEDDSVGAISLTEPVSLGALVPDRTVHVRSYSKSHGPDLRIAALSAPHALVGELLARRQLAQGWTSRLLQRVLLDLLTRKESVAAVAAARTEYARRREALVAGLARRGITCPGTDGINVWVPVGDETAALVHLAGLGIGVAPGSPFAVGRPEVPHVRVTAGLVREGHDELAEALAQAALARSWSGRHR